MYENKPLVQYTPRTSGQDVAFVLKVDIVCNNINITSWKYDGL